MDSISSNPTSSNSTPDSTKSTPPPITRQPIMIKREDGTKVELPPTVTGERTDPRVSATISAVLQQPNNTTPTTAPDNLSTASTEDEDGDGFLPEIG